MKQCYICGKDCAHGDSHHVDCTHGDISDETVLLCRRCHRTYHDLGVEWFDDEYLDKALEIENKRRAIYGLPLMERKDVKRTDYWYKKHGIRFLDLIHQFERKCIAPLCGWEWLESHEGDICPEQCMEVKHDNGDMP